MDDNKRKIIVYVLISLCLYIAICSSVQRFLNPKLTETELFMLLLRNIVQEYR